MAFSARCNSLYQLSGGYGWKYFLIFNSSITMYYLHMPLIKVCNPPDYEYLDPLSSEEVFLR